MASSICLVSIIFLFSSALCTYVGANVSNYCGQLKFSSKYGGNIEFKGNSSSPKSCTYEINVDRSRRIILDWLKFTVDGEMPRCLKSSVAVYIGCDSRSRKISDFCSKNTDSLPHAIYSMDHCMKLVFQSTSSATNEAFSAKYRTVQASDPESTSRCESKSYRSSKSGIIISPSWPLKQRSSFFSDECEWEVKVPSDFVIKMNFMDVDLYKSSYYCSSSSNRLRLKGEKSVLTSYENKNYYCGTNSPFSKTTRYYQLELEYKFRSVGSRRGFAVGYIAYRTDETQKAAKSQSRLAYIGFGIAVIVLVSCCIFFVWRRRRRSQQSGHAAYHPPQSQESHTAIATQPKVPDYGTGPPSGAPPPYSASITQPPAQGYPVQTQSQSPYPSATPYPTNAAPYPTNAAPYPTNAAPYPTNAAPYPTNAAPYPASDAQYPGSMPYSTTAAVPSYQADAPYQASAPYPTSQPPYPAGGQAPYPTK